MFSFAQILALNMWYSDTLDENENHLLDKDKIHKSLNTTTGNDKFQMPLLICGKQNASVWVVQKFHLTTEHSFNAATFICHGRFPTFVKNESDVHSLSAGVYCAVRRPKVNLKKQQNDKSFASAIVWSSDVCSLLASTPQGGVLFQKSRHKSFQSVYLRMFPLWFCQNC